MSRLEEIIASGTPFKRKRDNWIKCADGFRLSVIANAGAYCSPRPQFTGISNGEVAEDFAGPFTAVEVGYPSAQPEPWAEWAEYCESMDGHYETVYAYVPVDLVRALVAAHGGEVGASSTPPTLED